MYPAHATLKGSFHACNRLIGSGRGAIEADLHVMGGEVFKKPQDLLTDQSAVGKDDHKQAVPFGMAVYRWKIFSYKRLAARKHQIKAARLRDLV
jgi:hypothetical protein